MTTTTSATTIDTADELEVLRQRAEDGQRAVEALQAAEHARQARRTHELSEQQTSYDRDLCQRGPQVDAELDAQRAEALGDLSAAVERNDLGDALAAWRRECSARLAQRAYRTAWRGAYDRCAEGAPPPAESSRDPERDESLGFLPAVERAASASAQTEAELALAGLVGERPSALPDELLPGTGTALQHIPGCPDPSRTEVTRPPVGRSSEGAVVRCMSCGASLLLYAPPVEVEDIVAAQPGPALLRQPEPDSPYGFA